MDDLNKCNSCRKSINLTCINNKCEYEPTETSPYRKVCDACGKESKTYVASSCYGACSYAYCEECLMSGREPYDAIVTYISCGGHFPDDISEAYQKDVRKQLKLHGISEEQFIKDVDDAIKQMDSLCEKMDNENYECDTDEL